MALDKRILSQYLSEKQEVLEDRERIERYELKISRIEKRIAEIEDGYTVKDKVRGGEGGLQSFVIEGVPYDEYNDKIADLELAKRMLCKTKSVLKDKEVALLLRTKEVEQFVSNINDSFTRRIVALRVLDGLKWIEIAEKMGGGNTEGCVKSIYHRFIEKK
jgi:hypothetical protein